MHVIFVLQPAKLAPRFYFECNE